MAITKFTTSSLRSPVSKFSSFFAGNDQAFEHIQTITVPSGGSSSVTFSNIPQNYRNLQLRATASNNGTGFNAQMTFNGDTASNYSWHYFYGNGTTVTPGYTAPSSNILWDSNAGTTSTIFNAHIVDILDYASTSKNKTTRVLDGGEYNGTSTGYIVFWSGAWRNNTSAITSITIAGGTFRQNSTFSLYGIK